MGSEKKQVLIDANVFIALVHPSDSLNKKAEEIFSVLIDEGVQFVTNNYIRAESYTVLLNRSKSPDLILFLKNTIFDSKSSPIDIIYILDICEKNIIELMMQQTRFKSEFLSFADCSLIYQARKQKIDTIFTFDKSFAQFKREFEIVGI